MTRYVNKLSQGATACSTAVATAHPSLAGVAVRFPPHRYTQQEAISALTNFETRPSRFSGLTEASDAYLEIALDLGERALLAALDQAQVKPSELDILFSTTVAGPAVRRLPARLARRVGLRADVKRIPLFGSGCASGVAHVHDHLCAFPDQVAAVLAVELCSLTIQRQHNSGTKLVTTSLLGDGAAAVIAKGANRTGDGRSGPRVLATHSRIHPGIDEVKSWKIGGDGFRSALSGDVAAIIDKYLGDDVRAFLANHGLAPREVATWVCHPGGARVIEAVEKALQLPGNALDRTRKSLRDNGNLASVSLLDVLRAHLADPPPSGSIGLMIAIGPAFCSELALLAW